MRYLLTSLAAAAAMLSVSPAFAGPAETAFLVRLAGSWTGTGSVTGAEDGTLSCKLSFKPSGVRLSFSGRCNATGIDAPPQSFMGSLGYNDAAKQYEAKGADQVSVGVKSGSSVTFTTKLRQMGAVGTSVMKLSAKSIVIDVDVVRTGTEKHYKGHMTFTK